MGPGEAQPGCPLRRLVPLHMLPQLPSHHRQVPQGVRDGGYRLITDLQRLLSAGALPVVDRRILSQGLGKLGPVMDQNGAEAHHLLVEIRQGGQQVRPLFAVPEDAGLVLVEPVVLRERRGIPGAKLT